MANPFGEKNIGPDVEHGLDQVSDVFHVPWYAFVGHVYARSRFW